MSHPLCGADLATLRTVFGRPGKIAAGKRVQVLGIWASALAKSPISALERKIISPRLPAPEEMPPPIFILGHWRSGTTHLYNIMVKAETFGFVDPIATGLPWDLFGIAHYLRPLLERTIPRDRYIDNIPVTADAPQEDEIALASMTPTSFYHAIYFPQRFHEELERGLYPESWGQKDEASRRFAFQHFLQKLGHRDRKPLLIKNPVYTACPDFVRSVFPHAKFIHIHRNPLDVYLSMRNFYAKLLPVFALQDYDHLDIDEVVLSTYDKMMNRLQAQSAGLAAPEYIEIGYDQLNSRPIETVRQIYETLELDGFEEACSKFERYLKTIKTYQKNQFRGSREILETLSKRWQPHFEKWGYALPQLMDQSTD